jgi:hypothetical protein
LYLFYRSSFDHEDLKNEISSWKKKVYEEEQEKKLAKTKLKRLEHKAKWATKRRSVTDLPKPPKSEIKDIQTNQRFPFDD